MTIWYFVKSALKHGGAGLLLLVLGPTAALYGADTIDYGKDVYPLLKENCLNCHAAPYTDGRSGRKQKPKGGLRLDTHAGIMMGYEEDGKRVPVVVPGDPEKSTLFTSTALDPDHDDIMPAKGDPLTKAQQEILKRWIAQGAKANGFKEPLYVNPKAKK